MLSVKDLLVFFSALDSIDDADINTIIDAFVVLNNDIEKGIAKEKTTKKSILIKKIRTDAPDMKHPFYYFAF